MQEKLFDMAVDVSAFDNSMLKAAKGYIAQLDSEGLLDPTDVLTVQLVLSLSEAIGEAAKKGRAAGMANAAKELREAMELLPKRIKLGSFDQFIKAIQDGPQGISGDELYA